MTDALLSEARVAALIDEYDRGCDLYRPLHQHGTHFGTFNRVSDEMAEQAALLQSVERSEDRYRIVSLGAAPGEWSVRAARAYRWRREDGDFRSYNLEGDLDHVNIIRDFFRDNEADAGEHELQYRVIAERDGWAYFPIINPDVDWGAGIAALSDSQDDLDCKITMTETAKSDRIGANGGKPLEFRTVPAVSLATLLEETGTVDFLHSDIQGAEKDVFPGQMAALDRSVKMCCIGTHGKSIERDLLAAFAKSGWTLQAAYSCGSQGEGDAEKVFKDGVFVWTNPRFD